jgi:uncharacterized protein (DUF305 family)
MVYFPDLILTTYYKTMSETLFSSLLLKILLISLFLNTVISGCSGAKKASEVVDREQNLTEMESLYWARIESARMNFTQADVDFMTGMIAHHAQALIMSRLALKNGASRSVQTLAARIINAQSDEIALMQQWLRDRNQPVPEVHIDGLILMIHVRGDHVHDAMHHHNMPGMLTRGQLEELADAQGKEFDRKFLQFMIEHHKGAVIMVQELFNTDGAASGTETFNLASGINAEQITEIERMKLMLESIE